MCCSSVTERVARLFSSLSRRQVVIGLCAFVASACVGAAAMAGARNDATELSTGIIDRADPEIGRAFGEPSNPRQAVEPGEESTRLGAPKTVGGQTSDTDSVGGDDPGSDQASETTVSSPEGANGDASSTTPAAQPTTSGSDDEQAGGLTPSTTPDAAAPSPTTTGDQTTGPTAAPPTAAPSTTTTAAPSSGVASAFTTKVFTNWPIRNTNLDSRTQLVNTPASQINVQTVTEGSDRSISLGSITENKHLGQFRTQCSFSHFNYDDPLVFPGQPGKAHLHMYFGNTQANADSTYRSLRDGGSSSCNGFEGNRSAYWIPAVFDASGNARIPSRIELYYKSHDRAFEIVQKPPEGLGMVAGQAATSPFIKWACQETGAQGANLNRPIQQQQNTIPSCSKTSTLLAHIQFPQCLSGSISETSGNSTNQMTYPNNGYYSKSCPAGSQIITSIEYFIAWNPDNHDGQTQNWWLSSDVKPDGTRAANGSTLHGDWFGAWNPAVMDQIHESCVARLAECGWDLVNNNQRLTWIEHFGVKNSAGYTGPKAIPASELAAALCPGEHFHEPEDVAMCGDGHAPH